MRRWPLALLSCALLAACSGGSGGSPASPAVADADEHLVFAHYFTPYPLSFDNADPASDYYARNYLTPDGEDGRHAAYGGLLRDRPLPRAPLAGSDWQLLDMETEVRQAQAAGIDGFSLDLLTLDPADDKFVRGTTLLQAAHTVDPAFRIMVMPDMTTLKDTSADDLARALATLGKAPSAFHLADGRLVISPYEADLRPASWWKGVLDTLQGTYGTRVAFVPLFLDERPHLASFAPISYGFSSWGSRNPQSNDPTRTGRDSPVGRIQAVHRMGKLWMQPVSVQDERPRSGVFSEADNTTNLRDTWTVAREGRADWVQLVTWNDYSEGTEIAPSVNAGTTWLQISKVWMDWWRTGREPVVDHDVVWLTHRTQLVGASHSWPETSLMAITSGSPARDTVEALTLLKAAGSVTITSGGVATTCQVPAGVGVCTAALHAGAQSAAVAGGPTVSSPRGVVSHPVVQDLSYVAASSD